MGIISVEQLGPFRCKSVTLLWPKRVTQLPKKGYTLVLHLPKARGCRKKGLHNCRKGLHTCTFFGFVVKMHTKQGYTLALLAQKGYTLALDLAKKGLHTCPKGLHTCAPPPSLTSLPNPPFSPHSPPRSPPPQKKKKKKKK